MDSFLDKIILGPDWTYPITPVTARKRLAEATCLKETCIAKFWSFEHEGTIVNIDFTMRFVGDKVSLTAEKGFEGEGQKVKKGGLRGFWRRFIDHIFGRKVKPVYEGEVEIDLEAAGLAVPKFTGIWHAEKVEVKVKKEEVEVRPAIAIEQIKQSNDYKDAITIYEDINRIKEVPGLAGSIAYRLRLIAQDNPEAAAAASIEALKTMAIADKRFAQMKAGEVFALTGDKLGYELNFQAVSAMIDEAMPNLGFSDSGHIELVLKGMNSLDVVTWREDKTIILSEYYQKRIDEAILELQRIREQYPYFAQYTDSLIKNLQAV